MANDGFAQITLNFYLACPEARSASRTERRSSVFSAWRQPLPSRRPHSRSQFLLDTNGRFSPNSCRPARPGIPC